MEPVLYIFHYPFAAVFLNLPLILTWLAIFNWYLPERSFVKTGNFRNVFFNPLNKFLKHGLFWQKRKVAQVGFSFRWESHKPWFPHILKMIKCQVNSTHGYNPFTHRLVHLISWISKNNEPQITKIADD